MPKARADPKVVGTAGATETNPPTAKSSMSEDELAAHDAQLKSEREARFSDYVRVFSYAKPWDFVLMVMAAVASIGAGVTMPLLNVVFGRLVGDFNGYFMEPPRATQAQFDASLNRNSLYIFALFIAKFGLNYIAKFSLRMIGIRMSAGIRLDYLKCLFSQTIHVLDSMLPGAAAGTITSTANTLQLGISEKLGIFLEFMATIIAAIVVAFSTNWALTLVTCSVLLFILLSLGITLPLILKENAKQTAAETKSSSLASEAFSSIRMVTACGAEAQVVKRFAAWADVGQRHGQRSAIPMGTQFGLVFFALYSAFALTFWYGTKSYSEGRVGDVRDVVVVLMSVMLMVISLERISTPLLAISKAMVAACEFFTVIDAPKPDQGELRGPDVSATNDIHFRDVHFAYPTRPHVKVLDGLNLVIKSGKLTAIVGPSGSGKSTIVGLIERWYTLHNQIVIAKAVDPEQEKKKKLEQKMMEKAKGKASDEEEMVPVMNSEEIGPPVALKGSVSTSGHELDEINLKWWRSQIGLVQQEPFLFNDTIYNNVAHGLVGSVFENESEERKKELVIQACQESFADEFIDRLPDGYNTAVGDSGTKLSGGQRQRISIARAVIKKPKILILDEATSAIDVRGERIVQAALDKVSRGRTTITIAHRLSTIKKADNIVVLKKGRVVEQGTHRSLLEKQDSAYYGLVHAQKLSLGEPTEASDLDEPEEETLGAILCREKHVAVSNSDNREGKLQYKTKSLAGSFGRLLYEQRSRFPQYGLTILFSICTATASPVQAYLFAKIVVVFQYPPESASFSREANHWSLMWFVLALCVGFSYFVLGVVSVHLAHYISVTYRKQYFQGLLYQKTAFFDEEENSMGTLTARVGSDPKQLEELLGLNMAMVYNSIFVLLGSLAIAFAFGWKLALVALCVTVPLGLLAGYFRLQYEIEFEKMYGAVFAESSKFAAESIGAFRTVASMTLEDTITTRYDKLLSHHVVTAHKKARWTTLVFALSDSIDLGCQALIFWYGGRLLSTKEYSPLNFFVCYMAVIQGANAAGQGFGYGPNAAQTRAAANRILSVRESKNTDTKEMAHIPNIQGGVQIELRDVHFKYPTRNVSIFKGVNLTIAKGQFAALVGASGCGKTSIISLLERFYDVNRGKILANGIDITDLNVYEYRKHLSLVAQEASIFQGTLRDNILLGVDPKKVTDKELHAVCRDASIHDFIISLPDGYDTEVGSKGVSLSGGQKQRVSIARALVRRPNILLLDEATSSLDSESEKLVQKAFERAARGRTMIVVAHRLATVQNADVIFVLGEGKVLEKGNHAELLKRKGVYWNMCQSQALDR
ncbi:P-loop containing nucleoside triphosphate hydrolase protein [Pseudomassariella vexata]|uniref:p-loop containing nucleoside triphosphate hydrolase protein n=1 Tax=Pseudomassariella vexata TaxID=1141098 RepID=A0A1Y2E3S6_9PEZI|nr:P-loop containing nucleoside triphosphate hydrolase protein [Pseudomassariella vexata]ORY66201.1 P-loop containing nucleoside triphosphate hydrolase protein [Pseudomassariella vexata]